MEPEPEPEQQPPLTPVQLVWRETDELSSAESTPASAAGNQSWTQSLAGRSIPGSRSPAAAAGSGPTGAVALVWRETEDISSAENTPSSAMSASPSWSPRPPVLKWKETDEISDGESDIEDEEDEEDEEEEGSDDDSDGSWSERPESPTPAPGTVEARLEREIDARVAAELSLRSGDRALAVARGARDIAADVQALVAPGGELAELAQRLAPAGGNAEGGGAGADAQVWTETAGALTQLVEGLGARAAAATAFDPAPITRIQQRLVEAGRCVLLPGLDEPELGVLEKKSGAKFPPELRAWLRCGVPVDVAPAEVPAHERQTATGWVNWQLLVSRDVKLGGEEDLVSTVRSQWVALLPPEQAEQAAECPLLPVFGSCVMPTAPHRNGLPVWSAGAVCAPTFWAWLGSEMGLNESVPTEWTAEEAVPTAEVPFWPAGVSSLL